MNGKIIFNEHNNFTRIDLVVRQAHSLFFLNFLSKTFFFTFSRLTILIRALQRSDETEKSTKHFEANISIRAAN